MLVLGISDSSVCGGATITIDGQVIASVNEERLDRQKLSTGFPRLAISQVLSIAGASVNDIERVQVADRHNYFKPQSGYWAGWLVDHASKRKEILANLSSTISSVVGNSDRAQSAYYALKRRLTAKRPALLRELLRDEFGINSPIEHIDHHFCHATSAYYTAGFPDCTVITLDGGGDFLCSRVYRVREGNFVLLHTLRSYHSIGNFYAYITKICGFTAHKHEGKITGLAAYGEPLYKDLLAAMINFHGDDMCNTANAYYWSAVRKIERTLPKDYRIEDLAASIQKLLEDVVVKYCRCWIERSGIGDVALAGGVFANVRLNQQVHNLDCVNRIFIHPGMGDEGLSFGAALTPDTMPNRSTGDSIRHVYFGPEFSAAEMEEELSRHGVSYRRLDHIEVEVASLLAQGYVVARFNGRMEYGPRALGNRSILYQPNDRSANDWLNKHLDRTEFMPFAPAVPEENVGRCFEDVDGAEDTSHFMTITFNCTEEMQRLCAGVTHIDNTARPQVVRKSDNPSYYRIIKEYERLTGNPCIVNTSFNVHDEPIVCTPEDALNGFINGDLDYLAMGNFLAEGTNAQARQRIRHEALCPSRHETRR